MIAFYVTYGRATITMPSFTAKADFVDSPCVLENGFYLGVHIFLSSFLRN